MLEGERYGPKGGFPGPASELSFDNQENIDPELRDAATGGDDDMWVPSERQRQSWEDAVAAALRAAMEADPVDDAL